MDLLATPAGPVPQILTLEEYPLISPGKFLTLCLFSLGLYGLWWQYKTWRFFKRWQQSDIWPVPRALFSLFTINDLLKNINQFAYHTGEYTPLGNPTSLAAGYIILNLLARLPDPFWLVSLGAAGFLVAPYRAFREAMLRAPECGGRDQESFSRRHVVLLAVGLVCWGLLIVGLAKPS